MTAPPANPPSPSAGAIAVYIHPGSTLASMVELGCESKFVAQREEFLQLAHDLAMHVAAADPRFISRDGISAEMYHRLERGFINEALAAGRSQELAETIAAGKVQKYCRDACLNEQPFIKDPNVTIENLLAVSGEKLGDKITVTRFTRFKVGEYPRRDDSPPPNADLAGVPEPKPVTPGSKHGGAHAQLPPDDER
jgi:elongation factor Ts